MTKREIKAVVAAIRQEMTARPELAASRVSAAAGCTKQTLQNMLEGRHTPWERTVRQVAEAVGVDVAGVLRGMSKTVLPVLLDAGAKMPTRAHADDAGLDVYAPSLMAATTIQPGGSAVIDTGLHVAVPVGYVGLLKSKSGLNMLHGITSEGVIDAGYTGMVRVKLYNMSEHPYTVYGGDKVSQLVIVPCLTPEPVLFDEFAKTDRGDSGFGSSGR